MTPLQTPLISDGAFATPAQVLESLTAKETKTWPPGAPHSRYEELWRMDFWQRLMLSVMRGESGACPGHAAAGWPKDNETLTEDA